MYEIILYIILFAAFVVLYQYHCLKRWQEQIKMFHSLNQNTISNDNLFFKYKILLESLDVYDKILKHNGLQNINIDVQKYSYHFDNEIIQEDWEYYDPFEHKYVKTLAIGHIISNNHRFLLYRSEKQINQN